MKFLYADSLDYVDPEYNFVRDRNGTSRRAYEDDEYPHEHLKHAPYDGLLVSRAIVGGVRQTGKYSHSQCIRFSREGARRFLRYPLDKYPKSMLMGDCGAFSYRNLPEAPYSVTDMLEFYEDSGFTHGCSVDHVIFTYDEKEGKASNDDRLRYESTLQNARQFLRESKALKRFVPVGVIQGWSPTSMAAAAEKLVSMGYRYLAVGGMVRSKIAQIAKALEAIREHIPSATRLHMLGFGKTDQLRVLSYYKVTSFDTTSPTFRAFKDAKRNYYAIDSSGQLTYYTALRIPQAIDNDDLVRHAKRGRLSQDRFLRLEATALDSVRRFAQGLCSTEESVNAILEYDEYALWTDKLSEEKNREHLNNLRIAYTRTLEDRAWEHCDCRVCKEVGIEAMIFRSSNRNKRRGFHNLHVFYNSLNAERA